MKGKIYEMTHIYHIDYHDEIDASIRKAKSSDKFEEQSVPLHHPINALHFSVYISILDIHCEDTT